MSRGTFWLRWISGAAMAATVLALPRGSWSAEGSRQSLTVYAAASLSEAFADLGRQFEKSRPGWAVRFQFAGSQQLATQLETGAGADVFASADDRWMDHARERGSVESESRTFARNRLVVIVPRSNPGRIDGLPGLARPGLKLVLGSETVPVGKYSREVLGRLGRLPGYPDRYARRVLSNLVSEEENVKAVASKIELGEADAGIVYRSDVTPGVARLVRVYEIPEAANVLASYPIAVVRGTRQAEAARGFVDWVLSPRGQETLAKHGLIPAAATP